VNGVAPGFEGYAWPLSQPWSDDAGQARWALAMRGPEAVGESAPERPVLLRDGLLPLIWAELEGRLDRLPRGEAAPHCALGVWDRLPSTLQARLGWFEIVPAECDRPARDPAPQVTRFVLAGVAASYLTSWPGLRRQLDAAQARWMALGKPPLEVCLTFKDEPWSRPEKHTFPNRLLQEIVARFGSGFAAGSVDELLARPSLSGTEFCEIFEPWIVATPAWEQRAAARGARVFRGEARAEGLPPGATLAFAGGLELRWGRMAVGGQTDSRWRALDEYARAVALPTTGTEHSSMYPWSDPLEFAVRAALSGEGTAHNGS
jgi:hypothetical protein